MAKKKTQEIFIPKPIGEVTTSNYLDIANYVNSSRHMCDILDGCKPSYRRLIWAGFQFPKGKLIPTTKLIAEVSNYHPHSTSGIEGTNAVLVNSGVFTGEGSFGFTSITGEYNPPAATRYTKNRVSDLYHDIMGDALKYVEMVESPVEALEPRYLPLPLPLCLKYDTKIRLLDGRDLTIKEIVEEFKSGKENFVLSCSPEGRFTVSKIIWGDKTKITNKYVRLELDNGEVVESTLDHRFMMRDGSYKEAKDLVPGDSMMPGKISHDKNEATRFPNKDEELESLRVIKIEIIEGNENIDFYDITVDSCYHNFLLSSGIVAHNCLFLSQQISGLGFSVSTLYPNFSPVSLYNAYIHNDPSLLEPRVDLELDKGKSELLGLWRYGKGKVTYSYHTQRVSDPSTKREGVLIYGDTSIFTPRLTKIRKLMEDGKAYMEDMTDEGGPKLFIGRVPGARGITVDDIWKITETIKSGTLSCVLNITNGTMTYRIPLYDWLDYTIKNYHNLISFSNQDKIRRTEFEIQVQEAIPVVTDYILNRNPKATDKELVANLGLSIEVIQEVLKKPISNLRKTKDTSDKIKALKAKLKSLKAFDPVVFTEDIIGKL